MIKLCLITQAYFDANKDLIRSLWAQAEPGANIQPVVAEGGLLRCRRLDPSLIEPPAVVHELPTILEGESKGSYRLRVGTDTVNGFNDVKDGLKDVFYLQDQNSLFDCQTMNGWPALI